MARKRLATRSILVGIVVAGVAILASTTRTKPFDCEQYLAANNSNQLDDPRAMGCLFRKHIDENMSARISQEGRIQRDTDTFFWSLFANAFAANPNTPYLYTTLPLVSFDQWAWLPANRVHGVYNLLPVETLFVCLCKPRRFLQSYDSKT